MRTVLFGNNLAAVNALDELLDAGHEVICAVPFRGRVHDWHASLFDAARERGVSSVFDPRDVNDAFFLERVRRFAPDLLLSVYYDQRLGDELLELPRIGAVNLHPSLLPRYRGVAPLIWALANGESEVGVTLHEMDRQFDTGDIVLQRRVAVAADDTGYSLHLKVAAVGREIVRRFLVDPERELAAKRPQQGEGSYFSRNAPRLNRIDWRDPARRIHDIVRALTAPLPCAYSFVGDRRVLLLETRLVDAPASGAPGQVRRDADGRFLVTTGEGALVLRRIKVAGIELEQDADADSLAALLEGGSFDAGVDYEDVPAPPRLDRLVFFGQPALGQEEEQELLDTLRSGWIGTGPRTARLEQAFAELLGVPCVSFNSCASALYLALKTLPLQPGDEVITTPLTFAATANVIELLGGTTVFADVDAATLNLDAGAVSAAVTTKTRAILPVHFGGLPCDMPALEQVAREHGLAVIEDASHAIGARQGGVPVGARGNLAAFSLYATKTITAAEGGMLAGVSEELAERLRVLRLHGLSTDARQRFDSRTLILSQVVEPGLEMNMTDLQAALGLAQLRKLPRFLARKQALAAIYDRHFSDCPLLTLQPRPAPGSDDRHGLHLYLLRLELERLRLSRNEIVQLLRERNVGAGIHYEALFFHPYYRRRYGHDPGDFPHAASASASLLSLPLSPGLDDRTAEAVARTVLEVLQWCAL